MLAIAYIVTVSGLFVLVDRWAPEPADKRDQSALELLFFLGCYLTGGAIGFFLPELLAQYIGVPWADGWLERLAKVFGAIGGTVITVRGQVILASIFVLGVVGKILLWIGGYIFGR